MALTRFKLGGWCLAAADFARSLLTKRRLLIVLTSAATSLRLSGSTRSMSPAPENPAAGNSVSDGINLALFDPDKAKGGSVARYNVTRVRVEVAARPMSSSA